MINKILKITAEIVVIIMLLVVIVINKPIIIGFIAKTFTNNQINIEDISVNVDFANKTLFLSSKNIIFANKKSMHIIDNLQIIVNKKIKVSIDKLTSKIYAIRNNKLSNFLPDFLTIKQLNLDYLGLKINTTINAQKINNKLTIIGDIANFNIKNNLEYLEFIPLQEVKNYLQQALKNGELKKTIYSLTITDKDFSLKVIANIKNGTIKFHPLWPEVKNIDAKIVIDKKGLVINLNQATIEKLKAKGQVEVSWSNGVLVNVLAKAKVKTANAMDFLQKIPLQKLQNIKSTLKKLTLTGEAFSTVELSLPITNEQKKATIIVNADLINNDLKVINGKINIKNINAKLNYNKNLSIIGTGDMFNAKHNISLWLDKNLAINFSNKKDNINLKYIERIWLLNIKKPNLSGEIQLDFNQQQPIIYLNNFNIKNDSTKTTPEKSVIDIQANEVFDCEIHTNNIIINDKVMPNFTTNFINKNNGLHLDNFKFTDNNLQHQDITINGAWQDKDINLKVKAKDKSLNTLLKILGFKEKTKGGEYLLNLNASCACYPWEFALNKLKANLQVDIKKGFFSNQDPKLGRLLALLNVNTLLNKIAFRWDEALKKGFSYDTINAKINLNTGGIAIIDKFILNSQSSKIVTRGNFDVINKEYNLDASVIPALKDSVPVVAALTGGGVTGLVVWLADKILFKDKLLAGTIDKAAQINYKITGKFDNPKIKKYDITTTIK